MMGADAYLLLDLVLHGLQRLEDLLRLHVASDDQAQVLWAVELLVVVAYLKHQKPEVITCRELVNIIVTAFLISCELHRVTSG